MQGEPSPGTATAALAWRERPRLMVLHQGDHRLAALEHVLGDLGYRCSVVATPEDALAAIARGPLPDVLLTSCSPHGPHCSSGFPRECLARWPALRALYVSFISFVPPAVPDLLGTRESALAAPFNAAQLAAALAALWPGPAIASG